MSKIKSNIQAELKGFSKIFESLIRRHNQYKVFDDFLDMFINGFCFDYRINLKNLQSIYTQEERNTFGKLILETLNILNKELKTDVCFYDVFGTIYENQSLTNKHFAQFFTPINICELMASIAKPKKSYMSFSDPCSGSARLSLATNSVKIGMFHTLVDIDYTCAKMSALNLMLHGIDGIVICDDSLWEGKNFKGAFIVNRYLKYEKIPRIEFISNINLAYNYVRKRLGKEEKLEPLKNQNTIDQSDIQEFIVNPITNQFSLF